MELLTVGLLLALVIRQFAFDAFRVPSRSMEPTILGDVARGDQILVERISYQLRAPRRWEVVVFRYPLDQSVYYVKRVVGLPGELVLIARGDIFRQGAGDAAPGVARKPAAIQEAIFRTNPVLAEEVIALADPEVVAEHWELPAQVRGAPGALEIDARAGPVEVTLRREALPTNQRRDPAALARGRVGDPGRPEPVGDLRLELGITPHEGAVAVLLRLVDCTWPDRPLELEVAIAGSGGRSALRFGDAGSPDPALDTLSIPVGRPSTLILENADDCIRVLRDGDEVLSWPYRQELAAEVRGASHAAFGLQGGRATVQRAGLYRDLHYTLQQPYPRDRFRVPPGHYLVLGDNSPGSRDSRSWRAVGIRHEGRLLLGSLGGATDALDLDRVDNNPWPNPENAERHHFVDILGNTWELDAGSYDIMDLARFVAPGGRDLRQLHLSPLPHPPPGVIAYRRMGSRDLELLTARPRALASFSVPAPFVPREAIEGRAGLVFLPFGRQRILR